MFIIMFTSQYLFFYFYFEIYIYYAVKLYKSAFGKLKIQNLYFIILLDHL